MSRVESSDDQRIRELNEAAQRQKVDQEKRDAEERVGKAFNEVMAQAAQKEAAKNLQRKQMAGQGKSGKGAGQKGLKDKLTRGLPGGESELAKKAQLANAAAEGMLANRTHGQQKLKKTETDKVDDVVESADDDVEVVDKDTDRAERRDGRIHDKVKEERREELRQLDGAWVDPDRSRDRDRDRGQGGGEQEEPKPRGVEGVEGARGAHVVRLPIELLERIASDAAVGINAEGRHEVQVNLKGTMLDGVTLKVSSRKGKIVCTFEGCDKQTRNLIEASKGDLMRQLAKRGLDLELFRVH